jgi:hypothetical protein
MAGSHLLGTGVGGGIVAVVPGKMAIVGFSPRVNEAGNSVRAMKAIEYISDQLGVTCSAAADDVKRELLPRRGNPARPSLRTAFDPGQCYRASIGIESAHLRAYEMARDPGQRDKQ